MKTVLITGSSGLIGSDAVIFFAQIGWQVVGIDNNMRKQFFGPQGDTTWNLLHLKKEIDKFEHLDLDIRDQKGIQQLFQDKGFDLIIHCAAQPSHDWAQYHPIIDFDINAVGTLNLLEATRLYCPEAVFIHMSTNKVYGDAPNEIPLVELETRFDYADDKYKDGIDENMRIDQSKHSLFGASKLAADIMAQEYGRYFGLKSVIFRGGCLTGPAHSGVELHGFLNYLIKTIKSGKVYTIFGYKGKQVRDQIHSCDVIQAFYEFYKNPKGNGEVYNIGGGRENSASIIECFQIIENKLGKKVRYEYCEKNRVGDHICYISDISKLKNHFPDWSITRSLDNIIDEILQFIK